MTRYDCCLPCHLSVVSYKPPQGSPRLFIYVYSCSEGNSMTNKDSITKRYKHTVQNNEDMMTSSNGNFFLRYRPFVRGIHRWIPLTKASDAELWCFLWSAPWINGWVNNREAGDLRRHRAHYDVTLMSYRSHIEQIVSQLCIEEGDT